MMPHGVKSPGSIAKRKAAREGKQRTGFVEPVVELAKVPSEIVVELAKVPSEMVELAKVPRECEAELVKVPVEEETAKFPCVVDVAENANISCDSEVMELVKVPRDCEQSELEKVPCDEEPEIEERIFKASIKSKEHEEACWFWRGGCRDEVDYSTWDQDGPSPVASPPCRADSPGIITTLPKRMRSGQVPKSRLGLRALRALMPQWSDKDHTGTVHTFFDEAARRSGLRKSELVLELMLDARDNKRRRDRR